MTDKNMILFDDWYNFIHKMSDLSINTSCDEKAVCQALGIDFATYSCFITEAIELWKESPSRSFFNGLQRAIPKPLQGDQVFNTLGDQTRFLLLANRTNFLTGATKIVRDDIGLPIRIKGKNALTLRDTNKVRANTAFTSLLQMLYVYKHCMANALKGKKAPKPLYRGIRFQDILWHKDLEPLIEAIPSGLKHLDRRKLLVDTVVSQITSKGLGAFFPNQLLSFTTSKSVAEYFCNGEGLVLEIQPSPENILTSESQDVRFTMIDSVSRRKEHEYIVHIPPSGINCTNIHIQDEDYLVATQSPLAVSLFSHSDKTATYVLNNIEIDAYWGWASNTRGRMLYLPKIEGYWGMSEKEFKREFGFSPLITPKNLTSVTNFSIKVS